MAMKKLGMALVVAVAILGLVCMAGPAAAGAKIKINIGSTYGPDAPVHFGQVKFKELVEQRSKGEMEVLIHVGGAMGGERDVFEGMSSGGLEMGAMGSGDTSIFFPKYQVFEVPYVMRDSDHFWKFWNGPVGKEINDLSLRERGVMTTGVVWRGARYLTANKPIRTVAEVKGLKIRLPENKPWIKIWETLGALPIVVAFPEVYMALKTGVAEAQENPMESIWSYKFYEAQKYLIATRHVFSACKYQVSKKWFDTLKPEQQQLILTAWKDATDFANEQAVAFDKKLLGDLQAKGMTLIEPDVAAFQKAVQPALQELNKTLWVPGMLEKMLAIK
jgi:tripartite ATP-independent transporter DctP family solute receptor